jgi:glycosyltransferase involved in cell wall biosynthesis
MKKINLLYVIYSLENGGAETLAIRLAEKIDKKKFHATVCSLTDGGPLKEVLEAKEVPYITLGKREGKDFKIVYRLIKQLKKNKIDIVHTHNQGPLLYTYLANIFSRKIKIVHTEHINMAKELSYSKKHLLYNKILYRSLDGFINIASHLTSNYCALFNLSNAKIQTIHNCVELSNYNSVANNSLRQELGISADVPLIGNISALRPQKDHATLIRSMVKVCEKLPESILVIVGEGESEQELLTLTKQLDLTRNVIFLGFRSDINNLLAQFDVFVLSSLYEGLPLCILEAMAAGKPIVATDVDGTNEILVNSKTGLLVPAGQPEKFAEALLSIIVDPDCAIEMGKSARKFVAVKHNIEKMITQYEAFYKEILDV